MRHCQYLIALAISSILFMIPQNNLSMNRPARSHIEKQVFGKLANGTPANIYTLTNKNGMQAKITNFGATVVSLAVPDRDGHLADVTLGYDDLRSYEADTSFFGGIIGRYANRIAGGRFSIEGIEYKLAQNNNGNHLHGGIRGFNRVLWKVITTEVNSAGASLKLSYLSKDGEEGYPGNLTATVIYTLTNSGDLKIDYSARTDKETVVNLTNHCYFSLAGAGSILKSELRINADRFTPTDKTSIPTGELRSVKNTPFDFLRPTPIGAGIEEQDEQLLFGNGYDHNYVLNKLRPGLTLAAEVYEPTSGRALQVLTTEPGLQFYSGNYLKDVKGKAGQVYQKREGFCLEAQHFPDSPNRPNFPAVVLKPGAFYRQTTIYRFTTR
jgi:aldose 1-epimerase